MTLPVLTSGQRAVGLKKAADARRARAALRHQLTSGTITVEDVFAAAAGGDRAAARISVRQMLTALPGIGQARAAKLMDGVGIAANRRVGGLGARQQRSLLSRLN